ARLRCGDGAPAGPVRPSGRPPPGSARAAAPPLGPRGGLCRLGAQAGHPRWPRGAGTRGDLREPLGDACRLLTELADRHPGRSLRLGARLGGGVGAVEILELLAAAPDLVLLPVELPDIEQVAARDDALFPQQPDDVLAVHTRADPGLDVVELALAAHRLEQRVIAQPGEQLAVQ